MREDAAAWAHLAGGRLGGNHIAIPDVAPGHPWALLARDRRVLHDQRRLDLVRAACEHSNPYQRLYLHCGMDINRPAPSQSAACTT